VSDLIEAAVRVLEIYRPDLLAKPARDNDNPSKGDKV
jgi:hypothetical protein